MGMNGNIGDSPRHQGWAYSPQLQSLERSGFQFAFLSVGLEGWINITDELRGGARVTTGPFIYNEADNELIGRIEGSGGYLIEAGVFLELAFSPHHAMMFGATFEAPSLEGGFLKDIAEWPDNKTTLWGVEVGWTYRM